MMTQQLWTAVDQFFANHLVPADPIFDEVMAACDAGGLPRYQVTPQQGRFLSILARLCSATSILEIGTLGGYSTIWLAQGLAEGGQIVTLELEAAHIEVARSNFQLAGVADLIEVQTGPALESLIQLHAEGVEPFDMTFIDADKPSNPEYFEWALKLSRPGSLIVVDNVVRDGAVIDESSDDANVEGVRRLCEMIAHEPRVSAAALQTVGEKGYDGFVIAIVNHID